MGNNNKREYRNSLGMTPDDYEIIGNKWEHSKGEYIFYSVMNNFINVEDSYGNGEGIIDPLKITFVNDLQDELPKNLKELLDLGINNQDIEYVTYAKVTGDVSGHECHQQHLLMIESYVGDKIINKTPLAGTSYFINQGGPIDACDLGSIGYDKSCWSSIYKGSNIPTKFKTFSFYNGGYCLKYLPSYKGGWKGVKVSLLFIVKVNVIGYCMQPNSENIKGNFCYKLLGDYFSEKQTGGMNVIAENYVKKYCDDKYPDSDLYTLKNENKIDQRDLEICACNLPRNAYENYNKSMGINVPQVVQTKCFLGDCQKSRFKSATLQQCPPPNCINIYEITGSNIEANMRVDQRNKCISINSTEMPKYLPLVPLKPINNTSKTGYILFGIGGVILLVLIISLILMLQE